MKLIFLVCVFFFFASKAQQKDKIATKFANTITAQDLRDHLKIIASDDYEGRETGSPGQKKAAKYIADHFKALGLKPPVENSYFQEFELSTFSTQSVYLIKGKEIKEADKDFIYRSRQSTDGEEKIKVTFLDEENLKGNYPRNFIALEADSVRGYEKKVKKITEYEGVMLIIKNEQSFNYLKTLSKIWGRSPVYKRLDFGKKLIIVNDEMMTWIFEQPYDELKSGEEAQLSFNASLLEESVTSENVLGLIKGSKYPDEVVVITAHYDHLGKIDDEIFNGADDDGSGTVAILELAEAFSVAMKNGHLPRRSILFMTVSGEEKGLLGSKHYTEVPIFPMDQTVVNLNIDMIGRIDEKHKNNPNYVYLIGSDKLSQDLHLLSEEVNLRYTGLALDYAYNSEDDPNRFYYRSDHYNFAKQQVPVIFYFNGIHEDYHRPTDTVEKIHFDNMTTITKLVFFTSWEIANRKKRIKLNERKEN